MNETHQLLKESEAGQAAKQLEGLLCVHSVKLQHLEGKLQATLSSLQMVANLHKELE